MTHFSPLAYIDPSSGTILLQALLAGVLGIVWRVTSLFRRRRQVDDTGLVSPAPSASGSPSKPASNE